MCKLYVVLISELNTAPPFSPPPLLLITTSVLQSNLIRIQFSSLCLSLSLLLVPPHPLQRRQSEGSAAADSDSSRAGLSECKKRLTSVHFIMDSYHIQPAMHAKYDSVMKERAKKICFVNVTFSSYQQLWLFFSFLQGNTTHTHTHR